MDLPMGSFRYINFKSKHSYKVDIKANNMLTELEVDDGFEKESIPHNKVKRLLVYGDIAAGQEININTTMDEEFPLPKRWFKSCYDNFVLQVEGDSMLNADIEDGDYVVIRQQDTASSGQIVAAIIEDGVTLKRFKKKEGDIYLLPENEDYQQIKLEEDIRILGVAVGLIKNI
ncbi:transcriptional repressor LexA [Orenia marismortui]|uniref:SOS regulatory protein LexA n=1 Tax=Orenia marismortui TaxID=46469 RepID=A0A4R8GYG1_9FIRM|nr:transcriptional repressor LexA [Orenia marismortui]TDX51511.1 SOS regulatory protein LexA [Orenia marismortui]